MVVLPTLPLIYFARNELLNSRVSSAFCCCLYLLEDIGLMGYLPFYWLLKPIALVAMWGVKVAGKTVHGTKILGKMLRA